MIVECQRSLDPALSVGVELQRLLLLSMLALSTFCPGVRNKTTDDTTRGRRILHVLVCVSVRSSVDQEVVLFLDHLS